MLSLEPNLYLVMTLGDDAAKPTGLMAAIDTGIASSVLFRLSSIGDAAPEGLKNLVSRAQSKGAAVLVADAPRIAARAGADGVHISWGPDVTRLAADARQTLGRSAIIGADAGRSRDDAMTLGEHDCDYVGFGIPAHVGDRAKARERQIELVAWWSEIFEVPSVAFDADRDDQTRALAGAGADFVALDLDWRVTAEEAIAKIQRFTSLLKRQEAVT